MGFKFGYVFTVRHSDNSPAVGIAISGVTTPSGGAVTTDVNGHAIGVASSSNVTVSISGYFDIANYSRTVVSTGIITPVNIVLTSSAKVGKFLTTTTLKSSRNLKVDLHLIGGGNDGVLPSTTDAAGGGGDGGKAYYIQNVTMAKGASYTAAVGAANGGASTFLGESSASGTVAGAGGYNSNGGAGGYSAIGNYPYGGGGGGISSVSGAPTYYNGGTPNGGNAAAFIPGNGLQPGGGGSGGYNGLYIDTSPGTGAAGGIFYSWEVA